MPSGHSSHIYNLGFSVCHEIIAIEIKGAHVQVAIRYIGVLTTLYVMYDMVVKGYMVTRTWTCCNRLVIEVLSFDCS